MSSWCREKRTRSGGIAAMVSTEQLPLAAASAASQGSTQREPSATRSLNRDVAPAFGSARPESSHRLPSPAATCAVCIEVKPLLVCGSAGCPLAGACGDCYSRWWSSAIEQHNQDDGAGPSEALAPPSAHTPPAPPRRLCVRPFACMVPQCLAPPFDETALTAAGVSLSWASHHRALLLRRAALDADTVHLRFTHERVVPLVRRLMSICEAIAASLVAISAAQRQIDNLGSGEAAWSAAQLTQAAESRRILRLRALESDVRAVLEGWPAEGLRQEAIWAWLLFTIDSGEAEADREAAAGRRGEARCHWDSGWGERGARPGIRFGDPYNDEEDDLRGQYDWEEGNDPLTGWGGGQPLWLGGDAGDVRRRRATAKVRAASRLFRCFRTAARSVDGRSGCGSGGEAALSTHHRSTEETTGDADATATPSALHTCPGVFSLAGGGTCSVCSAQVCTRCFEPTALASSSAADGAACAHPAAPASSAHECAPDSVKSVDALLATSQSCPSCFEAIFRSEGCDQMFCTRCYAFFLYSTGERIAPGVCAHNPHFFELDESIRARIREADESGARPDTRGGVAAGEGHPRTAAAAAAGSTQLNGDGFDVARLAIVPDGDPALAAAQHRMLRLHGHRLGDSVFLAEHPEEALLVQPPPPPEPREAALQALHRTMRAEAREADEDMRQLASTLQSFFQPAPPPVCFADAVRRESVFGFSPMARRIANLGNFEVEVDADIRDEGIIRRRGEESGPPEGLANPNAWNLSGGPQRRAAWEVAGRVALHQRDAAGLSESAVHEAAHGSSSSSSSRLMLRAERFWNFNKTSEELQRAFAYVLHLTEPELVDEAAEPLSCAALSRRLHRERELRSRVQRAQSVLRWRVPSTPPLSAEEIAADAAMPLWAQQQQPRPPTKSVASVNEEGCEAGLARDMSSPPYQPEKRPRRGTTAGHGGSAKIHHSSGVDGCGGGDCSTPNSSIAEDYVAALLAAEAALEPLQQKLQLREGFVRIMSALVREAAAARSVDARDASCAAMESAWAEIRREAADGRGVDRWWWGLRDGPLPGWQQPPGGPMRGAFRGIGY